MGGENQTEYVLIKIMRNLPIDFTQGNQFRALEEDEVHFLDGIMDEKITKENKRKQEENEELKNFREYVRNAFSTLFPSNLLRNLVEL
jgi:ATP adenylyltransferase/5',5'''-P-1,P-4-tetraphosphate phosphorylase II